MSYFGREVVAPLQGCSDQRSAAAGDAGCKQVVQWVVCQRGGWGGDAGAEPIAIAWSMEHGMVHI